jgi:hypothetical protein
MRIRSHHPELEPYLIAIGEMTTAWATLHEMLCSIFSVLMLERLPRPGDAVNLTPTYLWHTIKSDRTQREMLGTAFKRSSALEEHTAKEEIKSLGVWLLEACTKLEDRRNDAVHSSLILTIENDGTKEIRPNLFMRNPRAEKLSNLEDLLEELQCARDNIIKVFFFAQELNDVLVNQHLPLPSRPELPGRKRKEKREAAPTRSPTK